ncbi:hypothetical protein [Sinosporangium siamense]|uniref:Uncharacterized protein n=1 Tax=Sinosporangium siamense TaxID=1367973 RepID=A0A919RIT1_9ACTN|nr:hypothetical protein [Sinosporangium siamense]GII94582.1 hypothetical protein Ssi02_48130 [Sinosporangium siamense]
MTVEQASGDDALHGRIVSTNDGVPVRLCHHGCDCWQRNFDRYIETTPVRTSEQLDNLESHALLQAKSGASRLIRRHADEMEKGRHRLIGTESAARAALASFREGVEANTVGVALNGMSRLAAERVRTRTPRRPLWLRVIVWPVILAVGAFDTWYFQGIFQSFLGNAHISALEGVVTLFPGLVLTAGILVGGMALGSSVHRALRLHAERQATRKGWRHRLYGLGPWALRLVVPILLLLVAAMWALFRAREANLDTMAEAAGGVTQLALPEMFVAVLVATLTLCALAVKCAAYDPYASEEFAVRWRGRFARLRVARRRRRAGMRVKEHTVAWSDLCALRDSLVSQISEKYGNAYQFMMYARGFHEKAGSLPPVFSTGERGTALRERVRPELTGVVGPEPEFGALNQVEEVIEAFDPDEMRAELDALCERLLRQRAAVVVAVK